MKAQSLDPKIIIAIKNRLVKTYHPRAIYLLEPHRTEEPDVDILIIVDKANEQRYDLMAQGHKALIGIKIPKNILVYTKNEFDDYSKDTSTLSYLIKQNGKKIYAKA
jgi:hypothetical protein